MDNRRVIIVDFNHLAYKYLFGSAPLSHVINVNNVPTKINTTIQTYTIKALHRWSNRGINPMAVCFDSPCGSRKAYFSSTNTATKEYKGGRKGLPPKAIEAINMVANLLVAGGVSCYRATNYEADDLVFACVDMAKRLYPDLPIDIITSDLDLVPLVDEQVSVFLQSTKYTRAVSKDIEKRHYVQITPDTYQKEMESLSYFKTGNIEVPYNSVLLYKLLRGDKSDGIVGNPDFKPRIYNQVIQLLLDNNEDMCDLFRYGKERPVYNNEGKLIAYRDPVELDRICEVLVKYIEDDDIEWVRKIYRGINLNTSYLNVPDNLKRTPIELKSEIKGYSADKLQQSVDLLNIRLPL